MLLDVSNEISIYPVCVVVEDEEVVVEVVLEVETG